MTTAQRQATRRYRERRRKSGLARLEVQVPADAIPVIRKAASLLREQANEAVSLRRHLGFEDNANVESALDIFAMKETLRPEQETLWENAMGQVRRDRHDAKFNRARKVKL